MNNLNNYPYERTLRFFEAYYPYDVEDVHYSEVLLSMNQCSSIDELLSVRERLKDKINNIDLYELLKLKNDVNKKLSSCDSSIVDTYSYDEMESNLRADVNSCYDDNIIRLLKERETITANACGECFINLSHCSKNSSYKDVIIHEAKKRANIDVTDLLEKIAKRYEDFSEHWNAYIKFVEGMNGYLPAKQAVEDDFDYLKQFNWRLVPSEKSLYSEIDREEIKKKEKLKRKKIEEELIKIKKKRRDSKIKIVIGIIVFVIILVLFWMYGPSGGLENWIFAIIVILALLKKG